MAGTSQPTPLFSESPLATLLVDKEGVVLDANAVALKTLARPRARVVGEPLLGFVIQEDRQRARDLFQLVLGGRGQSWTTRIKRGDGVPRAQGLRAVPLGNGSGIQGILIFARDLGGGSEGRPDSIQLQTLLENLPEQFVVVLDRQGRIRYSSGLGRTHYLADVKSLGKPYQELLSEDTQAARSLTSLLEETSRGQDWAGTIWHQRKDGSTFPAQVFASPYLDHRTGRVHGALVVGRDASLVHRWRERAETAEPLANVGKLVASIGKELTTGLDRIRTALGGPAALDGGGTGGLDLGKLSEEVERMGGFLEKLEEFSKKGDVKKEEVPFGEVLQAVLSELKDRIRDGGAKIKRSLPSDLPSVWGDGDGLRKVVEAVLENAVDALEESGGGDLEVSLQRKSQALVLKVSNGGSKVRSDWLQEIFEPFFTTRPGRAGLGLSVAKGVVLGHGGRIWAESPEPETLRITVEIPVEPPESRIPFRPVPLTLARARSILVVDDDEAIRQALRVFLEKVGFEVREAWSGRSALAQLTTGRPPELVITDLRMDDGSGYWFLEALKRDFPKLVAKTIIITGDTRAEAAGELAEKTGCPLIRKPFDLSYLLEVIDEVSLKN
jgi:PAS domain S-box-containing protein